MELVNSLFTNLTEAETTALNGGARCRPVFQTICRPRPPFLRPPFLRPILCLRRLVYVCS